MPGAVIRTEWKLGVTSAGVTSPTVARIDRATAWQAVLKAPTSTSGNGSSPCPQNPVAPRTTRINA